MYEELCADFVMGGGEGLAISEEVNFKDRTHRTSGCGTRPVNARKMDDTGTGLKTRATESSRYRTH